MEPVKKHDAALANWPDENVKYMPAPEVEQLASDIMAMCKEMNWRGEARVYFQFQKEMSGHKAGNCSRIPPKLQDISKYDFVITIDWEKWHLLEVEKKQRIVYHELCHIGKNDNLEWCSAKHEFEGFVGEWVRFGSAIREDIHLGKIFKQQSLGLSFDKVTVDELLEAETQPVGV